MAGWLEIAVFSTPEKVEAVAHIMQEFGSGGVIIEDPALILAALKQGSRETIAPSLQVPVEKDTVVKGYFQRDCTLSNRLEELARFFTKLDLRWQLREVFEEDWAHTWRQYYKPVPVGKRLVVKPSWEEYTAQGEEIVIDLDPGMAFGCGTHATTALCLMLLEDQVQGGELVYDVGTGSGILAVAAALLGARQVVAVDNDELAVRVARENVVKNRVADKVVVLQGNLLDQPLDTGADLVVANIIADVIILLLPDAIQLLKPGGYFLASGIIRDRAAEVRAALHRAGLVLVQELEQGEWVALLSRKVEER